MVTYPPGIVGSARSDLSVLVATIRDPLSSLPPACYRERMVVTRNFGLARIYVTDPALIHELFVRNADALTKTPATKQVLGPALGNGLLTADGSAWRWQRHTLAPAFQHEKLVALVPRMIAAAEATRNRWLAMPENATVDLGHEMMRTTFDIILETMLSGPKGIDPARMERGVSDYLGATSWMLGLALLKAPGWVPFPGKTRAAAAARLMRQTVGARIAERRVADGGPADLIGMLLAAADPETGATMSNADIADNIVTFIVAGHETTAVALGWTLALLGDHPDIAAKLRAEIDSVTGGRPVAAAHVAKLTFARQVVSEAMRLYPPAPMIVRRVDRPVEIEGVSITTGSIIIVPIHGVHRHAALWPDPDRFDPDRFAADAVRARHRFAYMPFGVGPRICIGNAFALLEAVAILAVLLKDVTLERVESTLPEAVMRLTLRPRRPIRMRVGARRHSL